MKEPTSPTSDGASCSACVICGCEPAFPQPADEPYVCYSCGITSERSCEKCSLNDYCPMPHQKPKAFGCPLYLPNAIALAQPGRNETPTP